MRPLLTLPYLNLYLHEGPAPVLELQWLSYVSSADFRAAATQALELTRTHHAKAWVGDDRLLGAVRPRDLEWAEQTILSPLAQAGLERFARLESQDALNSLLISGMYTRAAASVPFTIRHFGDLLTARAWASGG
ncbi:MAG: hypothetical protein EOO62_03765 [Hymenobacter sp.]|nr:MAG: hypothetical protein EOO62_03765 [Hymenobacter sp.]